MDVTKLSRRNEILRASFSRIVPRQWDSFIQRYDISASLGRASKPTHTWQFAPLYPHSERRNRNVVLFAGARQVDQAIGQLVINLLRGVVRNAVRHVGGFSVYGGYHAGGLGAADASGLGVPDCQFQGVRVFLFSIWHDLAPCAAVGRQWHGGLVSERSR